MKLVLTFLFAIMLAACAMQPPAPIPDAPCASVPGDDVVDGGIGGTGKQVAGECEEVVF